MLFWTGGMQFRQPCRKIFARRLKRFWCMSEKHLENNNIFQKFFLKVPNDKLNAVSTTPPNNLLRRARIFSQCQKKIFFQKGYSSSKSYKNAVSITPSKNSRQKHEVFLPNVRD